MRMGAKGKPFYRLVVKERRSKRDGKYLENVGTYNPMVDPAEVILNHDRIQYWIGVGARPTETVASLIENNPVQTEEERAADLQAREAKRESESKAKAAARKDEEEKRRAEKLEAEKVKAEAAAVEAAEVEAETPIEVEAAAPEAVEADSAPVETAEAEVEAPVAETVEENPVAESAEA